MKRSIPFFLRSVVLGLLLFTGASAFASHIVGGDIYYTWITGNTYKVTLVLYGDCGPASAGAFGTLPTTVPQVCVYDGTVPMATLALTIQPPSAGVEITPICPDSLSLSQCQNPSNPIPGIKKFVYSVNYTIPYTSSNWRFVYNSNATSGSSAGRAAAITNIVGPGGTLVELTATLNNTVYNNTSPNLTVVPTPFFCLNSPICYTPGAIDPDDDSLRFNLVPAVNATGNCTATGSPVAYTGTAWPGTPVSATTPLRCAAGSFSFNPVNGQVCFDPDFTQRSIVVYSVSEYRDGTLIGTCMREMTFLVRGCDATPPSPGSVADSGVIVADGPTDFHICGDDGNFRLMMNPTPALPTFHITATATGLPSGMTFQVLNNGTNAPTCIFRGNASSMSPGVYTFFLNLKDDACPISGINIIAYTVTIYPVPTIHHTVLAEADCTHRALVRVEPGGSGSPWTIKVSDPTLPAGTDTIQTFVASSNFTDTLEPGPLPGPNIYILTIFTSVSTECGLWDTVSLVVPEKLLPQADTLHPSYCGKNDGAIILTNLNPGGIDTVNYVKDGVVQTPFVGVVSPAGLLTVPNLRAGVYTNIVVQYGYCTSDPIGPVTLVDPPFTFRAVTSQDPTKCGFCDGWIRLYGLHPDQLDTVTYTKDGVTQPASSFFIASDSTISLNALCSGSYTTFTVKTAGTCSKTLLDVVTLTAPPIHVEFDTAIKYGCKGDTLMISNLSGPTSDLTYLWDFGDGGISTAIDPTHVYTNTIGATYIIKLFGTNTKCIDSFMLPLNLNHYLTTDFSQVPGEFVCQTDAVNFTNASTGTSPDYTWYFGDGTSLAATDASHTYTNMGTYNTMLVSHNVTVGTHCYDTLVRSIVVDSNSELTLKVSGDAKVLCRGQAVTISAIYTTSGQQSNAWEITDGFAINNRNPLMHAFEEAGTYAVNFNAKFRACPEKSASVNLDVMTVPGIYLGPDTTMCPSTGPITLKDDRNYGNMHAHWLWNTGERTAAIQATKPGEYVATVTIDGCSANDTVVVARDCYVEVPNVFTPNNDGLNDYFFPRKFLTRGVAEFRMNIYNRWGQLIYETTSTDGRGWDGALNGVPQPEGVYVYMIEVTFRDGVSEQHKGNVTLLR